MYMWRICTCGVLKAFELSFLILILPMYMWRICLNITWLPCMTLDSLSSRSVYCQEEMKGRKHRITDNDDMPLLPHCIIRFPNFELCRKLFVLSAVRVVSM